MQFEGLPGLLSRYMFDWGMIGDIGAGRPNLGQLMDVAVCRLIQFTLHTGDVVELDDKSIKVKIDRTGETVKIPRHTWESIAYTWANG